MADQREELGVEVEVEVEVDVDQGEFMEKLEDAMRAAFFSPSSAGTALAEILPTAQRTTGTEEDEILKMLATRYPRTFGQPDEFDVFNPPGMTQLLQQLGDWNSTMGSTSMPQVNRLHEQMQQLREMPRSAQDQQDVEEVADAVESMQTSLGFMHRSTGSMLPLLNSATDLLGENWTGAGSGSGTDGLDDDISQALSLLEGLRNMPGLNEALSGLSRYGAPGISQVMHQNLDSTIASIREMHIASETPQLPDLNDYDNFEYTSFTNNTSIRLLQLVQGSGSRSRLSAESESESESKHNLIELRMTVVDLDLDLDQKPDFNALSYVWGDHRPPIGQGYISKRSQRLFHVLCNGKKMSVTYNLFCFFRRLAAATEDPLRSVRETPIWIDQLCINQSDRPEKTIQVNMMDRIYHQAHTVVSWLGESDSQTDSAITLLGQLNTIPQDRFTDPAFEASQLVKEHPEDQWLALGALLSRPYFKRAWIVQEIAMAKEQLVICGDRVIPWEHLVHCSHVLKGSKAWTKLAQYVAVFQSAESQIAFGRSISPRFGSQLSALLAAQNTIRDPNVPPEDVLLLGRQFDATVTVDKFYAMLGLSRHRLTDSEKSGLPAPDYDKSLKEAALEFAEYHIRSSGTLSLLSMVEDSAHRTQGSPDFPSWLPDLAAPMLPLPLVSGDGKRPRPWSAGGGGGMRKSATNPRIINGDSLCVQGLKIDTVKVCAVPFSTAGDNEEWFQIFDFLSQSPPTPNIGGLRLGEAIWRTLTTSPDPVVGKGRSTTMDLDQEFGDWCISRIDPGRIRDRRLHDPMTAQMMMQGYRLDDTKFDLLAFGKNAPVDMAFGGGTARVEEVIQSNQLIFDALEKHKEGLETKSHADSGSQVQKSLERLWERDQDDIFPDRKRVRDTLRILDRFRQHDSPEKKGIQDSIDRFDAAIGMNLESRRLFFTDSGRVGMGPQSLTDGDEIWVLDGAEVPFVLRKGKGEGEAPTYRFIGQAFLLGAMDGEVAPSDPAQLVDVVLR